MATSLKTLIDRGQMVREVTSFPAGVSADGVVGFTIDGKNWVRVNRNGVFGSEEVGIWADGTDMTAKINSRLNHASIKTLVFDANGGGDIVISGTVTVPAGKVIKFVNGTKLIGSGSVVNAIVEASKGHYFAAASLTFTNAVSLEGAFTPENRGAVGNGVTDDTVSFQAALNMSIRPSGGILELIPNKNYKITTVTIPAFNTGTIPSFEIDGNGAIVTVSGANIGLVKEVSSQAVADVQVNSRVHFHHIRFLGDTSTGSQAIRLHCSYGSIIEYCSFTNFDKAVEMRFCLNGMLLNNFFSGNITYDILAGQGNWSGATGNNSQSNQTKFDHNRHYCRVGQLSCLEILNSSNMVVADCIFEGGNPVRNIHFEARNSTTVKQFYVERLHIENEPTECSVYLESSGAQIYIRNPWFQTQHVLVKQGYFLGNSDIVVEGISYIPGLPLFAVESAYSTVCMWQIRDAHTFGSYGAGLTAVLASYFVQTAGYSVPFYKRFVVLGGGSTYYAGDILQVPGQFLSSAVSNYSRFTGTLYTDGTVYLNNNTYKANDTFFYFQNAANANRQFIGYYDADTVVAWRTSGSRSVIVAHDTGGLLVGGTTNLAYSARTEVDMGLCTTSLGLPRGTTAQRDGTPNIGFIRYNTTTVAVEAYVGAAWVNLSSPAFTQITGLPTTLAGYGITDGVSTAGSYANPTWITSLAFSKLTGKPTTLAGYGITDGVSLTGTETITNKTLSAGTKINLGTVALGDIYYGNASGTLIRVPVGAAGDILTIDSGVPSWKPPSGGGGTSSEIFMKVVNADYTIPAGTANYHVIYYDPITATRTVTLDPSPDRIYTIYHGGLGAFNINFSVAINVNSSVSVTSLAQGESITFYYDGANYVVVK